MWLFNQHGMTSVVAYDPKHDYEKDFVDITDSKDTHLLIRARIKEDLEHVRDSVCPTLRIITNTSADYAYRAVITRELYKKYQAKEIDAIDYSSHFKEAAEKASTGSKDRHSAYMKVWSAMAALQPTLPYSGNKWTGSSYTSGGGYGTLWDDGYGTPTTKSKVNSTKAKHSVTKTGYDNMDEFWANYTYADLETPNSGPLSGFAVNDKVWHNVSGLGIVTGISHRDTEDADLVQVEFEAKPGNKRNFLSNFLYPVDAFDLDDAGVPVKVSDTDEFTDLTEVIDVDEVVALCDRKDCKLRLPHTHETTGTKEIVKFSEVPSEKGVDNRHTEGLYSYTLDKAEDGFANYPGLIEDFPDEALTTLDDDAHELLIRLREEREAGVVIAAADVFRIADEIRWDRADDAEKYKWACGHYPVPEKYMAEATNLVLSQPESHDGAGSTTSTTAQHDNNHSQEVQV